MYGKKQIQTNHRNTDWRQQTCVLAFRKRGDVECDTDNDGIRAARKDIIAVIVPATQESCTEICGPNSGGHEVLPSRKIERIVR
jgi:hypothetical protein